MGSKKNQLAQKARHHVTPRHAVPKPRIPVRVQIALLEAFDVRDVTLALAPEVRERALGIRPNASPADAMVCRDIAPTPDDMKKVMSAFDARNGVGGDRVPNVPPVPELVCSVEFKQDGRTQRHYGKKAWYRVGYGDCFATLVLCTGCAKELEPFCDTLVRL